MARMMLPLALAVATALVSAPAVVAYEATGFIKTCKGRFADANGRQWSFAGWVDASFLRWPITPLRAGAAAASLARICLLSRMSARQYAVCRRPVGAFQRCCSPTQSPVSQVEWVHDAHQ